MTECNYVRLIARAMNLGLSVNIVMRENYDEYTITLKEITHGDECPVSICITIRGNGHPIDYARLCKFVNDFEEKKLKTKMLQNIENKLTPDELAFIDWDTIKKGSTKR